MEEVFMLAQTKACAWVTNKYPSATFSYSDWCLSPIICLLSIWKFQFWVAYHFLAHH